MVAVRTGLHADNPVERAAAAASLAINTPLSRSLVAPLEQLAATDPDPRVRAAALGALVRGAGRRRAAAAWRSATEDASRDVRRRAAELAPALGDEATLRCVLALLDDRDGLVAETAAWALGELGDQARRPRVIATLCDVARAHEDPLARESAVAALGALGDQAALPTILAACQDKPTIRRRAVLALAPFEGAAVDAALERALQDKDWQVRQAAEDLTS